MLWIMTSYGRKCSLAADRAELKEELGIPSGVPVVLCVAGVVPKKRHFDLVEVMAQLQTPARLVLKGHGRLLAKVRAFCQRRVPQTILTGFKNQSELPRFYAMADLFVLPSLWEEFALVVNEAMCAARPVIGSDTVAASRALVRQSENGYVFAPGDVRALAHYLGALLSDAELREHFGQRSLEIISGWTDARAASWIIRALESASR